MVNYLKINKIFLKYNSIIKELCKVLIFYNNIFANLLRIIKHI